MSGKTGHCCSLCDYNTYRTWDRDRHSNKKHATNKINTPNTQTYPTSDQIGYASSCTSQCDSEGAQVALHNPTQQFCNKQKQKTTMGNQIRYRPNSWEHASAGLLSKYRKILYDAGIGKDKCRKGVPNLKEGIKELAKMSQDRIDGFGNIYYRFKRAQKESLHVRVKMWLCKLNV